MNKPSSAPKKSATGLVALTLLTALSTIGCEPSSYDVQNDTRNCLMAKVDGLYKKACNPEEAAKLVEFTLKNCKLRTSAKVGDKRFSPKEVESLVRETINQICKDALQKKGEKCLLL